MKTDPPNELFVSDPSPIKHLFDISRKDATTHAFITAWQMGYYSSFEEMLIRLACDLANKVELLTKHAVETAMKNPNPFFAKAPGSENAV